MEYLHLYAKAGVSLKQMVHLLEYQSKSRPLAKDGLNEPGVRKAIGILWESISVQRRTQLDSCTMWCFHTDELSDPELGEVYATCNQFASPTGELQVNFMDLIPVSHAVSFEPETTTSNPELDC